MSEIKSLAYVAGMAALSCLWKLRKTRILFKGASSLTKMVLCAQLPTTTVMTVL